MWEQVRGKHVLSIAVVAALAVAAFAASASSAQAASRCTVYANTAKGPYAGDVTRSVRTSCPFSRAVFGASIRVIVNAGGVGNGTFSTRSYSPVTKRWYRVRCAANGSLYTREHMTVDCRAGIGARVVYRAWAL